MASSHRNVQEIPVGFECPRGIQSGFQSRPLLGPKGGLLSRPRDDFTGIPGKPGIIWTLDAATGDFLWARSTHFQNVIVGVDVEGRKGIPNPELARPEIGQEVIVCPHASGGTNWQAAAYHPGTNALYSSGNNTCMEYTLLPVEPTTGMYHSSADYRKIPVPGPDENVGVFTAVSLETGRTLWQHRQRAGMGGSVLTTGGGLVFTTDDARRFRAFDAATGEVAGDAKVAAVARQILNAPGPVQVVEDGQVIGSISGVQVADALFEND